MSISFCNRGGKQTVAIKTGSTCTWLACQQPRLRHLQAHATYDIDRHTAKTGVKA